MKVKNSLVLSNVYKNKRICAKLYRKGDYMLSVNTEFRKGIMFVRLRGDLNKTTIGKLDKKVTNLVENIGIRNIVLNVSGLKSIDYKGISKLLYNYELCKNNEGRMLLCGNNSRIENKLKKSRILKYISEIKDELCAINVINKG